MKTMVSLFLFAGISFGTLAVHAAVVDKPNAPTDYLLVPGVYSATASQNGFTFTMEVELTKGTESNGVISNNMNIKNTISYASGTCTAAVSSKSEIRQDTIVTFDSVQVQNTGTNGMNCNASVEPGTTGYDVDAQTLTIFALDEAGNLTAFPMQRVQ